MLEEFKKSYIVLCKNLSFDIQDFLLPKINSSKKISNGYVLDLSTQGITLNTCTVLSKLLSTDHTFTKISLNDCMLPNEGIKVLANGLTTNTFCHHLDLKGNNISSSATEALGRMLSKNTSLKCLTLEWNAMGMLEDSFKTFCEGLAANNSLTTLDLRNNQISHDGANSIAKFLKNNCNLQKLDLRWNNIGLIGGRSILDSLETNKKLVKIELVGNNIPAEVIQSIEQTVKRNCELVDLQSKSSERQTILSNQLEAVKRHTNQQISSLYHRYDQQEDAMHSFEQSSSARIKKLQQTLVSRKQQIDDLTAKLTMAESELEISNSRVAEFSTLSKNYKDEKCDLIKHHQFELKRIKEEQLLSNAKHNKELLEMTEKNISHENKIDELTRKSNLANEELFEIKSQLMHQQAESKMKMVQADERYNMEKQKSKEAYKDAEDQKQAEIAKIRRGFEESEQTFRERINKLEQGRLDLEDEMTKCKNSAMADRLQAEEHLINIKQKWKTEEEQRLKQLEEKIRILTASKDEIHSHSLNQSSLVSELQSKNSSLVLENENYRRKIEDLNLELSGKNNEKMEEVGKVKLEFTQKLQRVEAERQNQYDLNDKISRLERELVDLSKQNRKKVDEKDHEISSLLEKIRSLEMELNQKREDDSQRATILQSAIQNYISKSPYTSR